jgi:hypothetical protein
VHWSTGDSLEPETFKGALEGADAVITAVGRASFHTSPSKAWYNLTVSSSSSSSSSSSYLVVLIYFPSQPGMV